MANKELNELAKVVDDYIYHNRLVKTDIASKLGMSGQGLYNLLHKPSFNANDANRILAAIGCKIEYHIVPIDKE